MKILLIIALKIRGEDNYSFRVIEDPTDEEVERIVAINGILADEDKFQKFYRWVRTEEKKRTNWGVALADAGLLYGPFDKVVFCGGRQ